MNTMRYPPRHHRRNARTGLSLIELVIVLVIIGVIATIAVPRLSRGSEGASISALTRDLSLLNKAVDHYAAEHGGEFPRLSRIEQQLTGTTTYTGDAWSAGDGEVAYGPYLRSIPPLPLGDRRGNTGIALVDGDDIGWLYNPFKGIIRPNLSRKNGTTDEDIVMAVINSTAFRRIDLVEPGS